MTEDRLPIINVVSVEEERFLAVLERTACHGKDRMRVGIFAGKTMDGREFLQIGERFFCDGETGRSIVVPE